MSDDADLDIDDVDIDGDDYEPPDIEGTEVEEYSPDSVVVKQTQDHVRQRVLKRYAGQLNAIEYAKAVQAELSSLTGPNERGTLIEAAMVKLSIDILAENVKPKSVREAAQAIEVLHRINGGIGSGSDRIPPAQRTELFAQVRAVLERTTGSDDKLPPVTREALEVTYEERS